MLHYKKRTDELDKQVNSALENQVSNDKKLRTSIEEMERELRESQRKQHGQENNFNQLQRQKEFSEVETRERIEKINRR